MRLIRFAIERWQITLVVFALFALLGISAFLTIPRSVDPHFPIPVIVIVAVQPGATAADMEQTVAKPIEDVLQGLDDVDEIGSTSSDGIAVIVADFSWASDPEKDYDQAVREINAIRSQLPANLQRLEFRKVRTTESAVVQFALVSDTASFRRMEKIAKDLREQLNQVPGVRFTRTFGLPRPELRVAIDSGRVAQLGVPLTTITDALRQGSTDLPAGVVHSGDQRYSVQAGGAFRSPAEVEDVPVRAGDGRVLRVRDVASVGWNYEEQPHFATINGKRAVWLTITQQDNVNVLDVQREALAVADAYRAQLPPDVKLELGFDQSIDITSKLDQLGTDFFIALALVLVTLLPLGTRASLVVLVSVPLSLAMGMAAISYLGFTLNQLTITGFIISLGLLVDDSIVVVENIARHLREGADRVAAALAGTQQIAEAVVGCTAVLLFAFLPLAFLPEGAGKFTRGLPVAVLCTVTASLIVSLTIVPFIASRLLPRNTDPHGNRFLRAVQGGIHRFYAPVLHWSLARPVAALSGAMLLCVAAFGLIPFIGASLFPPADAAYFLVEVKGPQGAAITQTARTVREVDAILAAEPDVKTRLANVGRGNPQVFYNVQEQDERSNYGAVLAVLERWHPTETPALIERLRGKFDAIAEARVNVRTFDNGPPVDAPIEVRVTGPDLGVLKRLAGEVEAAMRATPGARDIDNPVAVDRIDLNLGLDAGKAALLGVAPGAPRRAVRLALAGEAAGRIRDNEGDSYDVVVRLPMAERQPVSALQKVYVPSTSGGAIPLAQVATPYLESAPAQITRYQQQRDVRLSAFVAPGYLTQAVNDAAVARINRIALPPGYKVSIGGEAEARGKSFSGLGSIILLAVFGILGVLVIEFGRFREVLVVAGVIPLGMFGGLVALYITGNSLSYTAVIGFVALIGIEIKNSILLVDFTTQLRREGVALREAIERAGEVRFLPVLLTSVTAIGGLLPLAVSGSGLYGPLAVVIIGGLISSTLLSRVVTPVMYLLIVRHHEPPTLAERAALA